MLVEFGTEGEQAINLDLNGNVVVRDVLLRVGQSFSDNLADLTVLKVFVSCGDVWHLSGSCLLGRC